MILRSIIVTLIILSFLNKEMAFAQKEWTLDECIQYALVNNLDIETQTIITRVDKEQLNQAKRSRLPYIGANSSYNINFGKSVDPNTNDLTYSSFASNSYSLNSSVTLFDGFIKNNQIAYNRFVYLAGIEDEKTLKIDIAFEVMNAFHNTLYYKGLLEIVTQQKELSELNLKKVRKQVEVGISAQTDILEIDARLADEVLLVIRTQNNLKASLLELKRAMNFPVRDEMEIIDIKNDELIRTTELESADNVYSLALKHLPAVKAKNQLLNAFKKSVAISKGNLYPTLTMGAGYNTGYYETRTDEFENTISFKNQFKNNASQYLGASLSIPIFNRWNGRSNIKLTQLSFEKEKVGLENFKNQLYYEIESYCLELAAVSAEYTQAKKQTASNELAFEVAEKKKEQGLINILDFYTSKNLLSNAQSELLRTKLQYLLKRKTIDFYLGKPVLGVNLVSEKQ